MYAAHLRGADSLRAAAITSQQPSLLPRFWDGKPVVSPAQLLHPRARGILDLRVPRALPIGNVPNTGKSRAIESHNRQGCRPATLV